MKKRLALVLVLVMACCASLPTVHAQDSTTSVRIVLHVAPGFEATDDMMDTARMIIERRVNGLGVSEAIVQRQGDDQIIVEAQGIYDENIIDAVTTSTLLEFVDFSGGVGAGLQEGTCILTDVRKEIIDSRLEAGEIADYACPSEEPDAPPDEALLNNITGQPFTTVMTGEGLADATATPSQVGTLWMVNFTLSDGPVADPFVDYIASHPNEQLAIVLDGRLVSAPIIQSSYSSVAAAGLLEMGVITGNFTHDEARVLAAQLSYGALPVPLVVIEIATITRFEIEGLE
ncbi:MAG: hypothetical protein GYB65_22245 [Chloroflexi bacterium]|nr:hypothetical protein [Chloroflexota bacterium]